MPAATATRVFMLSSQPLFSQGVESLLCGRVGFEIVGRESDPTKAVAWIRKLKPDVVIVDSKDLASAPFSLVACLLKEDETVRIIALNLENQTIRVYHGEQRHALNVDDLIAAMQGDPISSSNPSCKTTEEISQRVDQGGARHAQIRKRK